MLRSCFFNIRIDWVSFEAVRDTLFRASGLSFDEDAIFSAAVRDLVRITLKFSAPTPQRLWPATLASLIRLQMRHSSLRAVVTWFAR